MNWDLKHHKIRRPRDGVSVVRIVSLSSCQRTEVKKLINRLYLKQQSPSVYVFVSACVYVFYYSCDRHHQIIQHCHRCDIYSSKEEAPKTLSSSLSHSLRVCHRTLSLVVYYYSVIDSKSPQVSRTFLSILTDLSNAVIRGGVSIHAPITIGISTTFMFYSTYDLSVFLFSFIFTLWSSETTKSS